MTDAPKNVLIIDDHCLVAEAFALLLQSRLGWNVQTCATVCQALDVLPNFKPDLIVIDYVLEGLSGARAIVRMWREKVAPIIVLTGFDDPKIRSRSFEAGAVDVILKGMPLPSICERLQNAITAKASRSEFYAFDAGEVLSPLQVEIIEMITQGRSNKEIGLALGMTEANVKYRVSEIMKVARVRNRTAVALWWQDAA